MKINFASPVSEYRLSNRDLLPCCLLDWCDCTLAAETLYCDSLSCVKHPQIPLLIIHMFLKIPLYMLVCVCVCTLLLQLCVHALRVFT